MMPLWVLEAPSCLLGSSLLPGTLQQSLHLLEVSSLFSAPCDKAGGIGCFSGRR